MIRSASATLLSLMAFVAWGQQKEGVSAEVLPEIVSLQKIWDDAAHNAFTDLIRFHDQWFCTFRESDSHAAGANGKIRVIVSEDGEAWESAALLEENGIDLRDPKLSIMPDGRLMLVAGGSLFADTYLTRAPRVAFSQDGYTWTETTRVLAEDHWLWRVTWHKGKAFCLSKMGDGPAERRTGYLYTSTDGLNWTWLTEFKVLGVSETTLRVMPDEEMVALVRPGFIGSSRPPYKEWTFHETGMKIGGPNFIRVPDGTLWAAARRYNPDGSKETVLARMTKETYESVLALPSRSDTGYPGLVWHDGLLWMSYYSSHGGKTSVYLARIRLPLRETDAE